MHPLALALERELRRWTDPGRAAAAKRYLKSDLEFIGVTTAQLRRTVRGVLPKPRAFSRGQLRVLVEALWAAGPFEMRVAAMELLVAAKQHLVVEDLGLVERLIREARTWALVDGLAAWVAGDIVERYREAATVLDRWAADEDFWLRRASLLALLVPLRRGEGDWDRFSRYADSMLEEREFFIRKAIGWVLREVGKRRPQVVADWLRPRLHRATGLTFREASRHLPPNLRTALAVERALRLREVAEPEVPPSEKSGK